MQKRNFWVITSGLLSSEDTRVLALLYMPIISSDAFGLYMGLSNLIDKTRLQSEMYEEQFLMDLYNFSEEKYKETREKLEAIGLLTTFKKDDVYLYRLNMPLTAKQFFFDGILGSYLRSEIGQENFDALMSYFTVPEVSRRGFENITKTFDDVFTVRSFDPISTNQYTFGRRNGSGVIVKDAYDFESLYEKLPVRLKKKSIYTKKIISQIASIAYVYNFTHEEIITILSESYDEENRRIFHDRIALVASNYYDQTYGMDNLTVEKKQTKSKKLDLSQIRPEDIISLFGQKMTNQSFALDTIRQFVNRNAVDIGLINAVIIMALRYHDELPSINYLEKVLSDWLSRDIKDGEDALRILEHVDKREETKKRKFTKPGISGEEPDWVDEIIDSLWEGEPHG